jgi:hypothetical protein
VIRCWDRQRTADVLATLCVHLRTSRSTPHMIDARSGDADAQSVRPALKQVSNQMRRRRRSSIE